MSTIILQGRTIGSQDCDSIGALMAANPQWSRRRLSIELAQRWNWRNGAGQLKDMAARSLLLKLEQRGLIQLPPRRRIPNNRMRSRRLPLLQWDEQPIESSLEDLGVIEIAQISSDRQKRSVFASALSQFHYLGYGGSVGQNVQYMVWDERGRLLACLLFGSSAWKCQERDRFIGWSVAQREAHLNWTTNNTRFLILPWVRVPHLASWILGRIARRIRRDWRAKYGQELYLLETFVEQERFKGTAYRAANWIRIGSTVGRTRQDRYNQIHAPIKDIYVYPLSQNFLEELCR